MQDIGEMNVQSVPVEETLLPLASRPQFNIEFAAF
jgi:hypothetical protein